MFDFLAKKPTSYAGIDIGTSSVKMVQLKLEENKAKLETYGFLDNFGTFEFSDNTNRIGKLKVLDDRIVEIIKKIVKEAGISTNEAVMSVPVFSTFSSIIEFPEMAGEEIAKAIPFEARQYIPVPLEEVILDWSIVGKKLNKEGGVPGVPKQFITQVMLVAIPKDIALKYARIAESAGLKLVALEAESFAMARSLVGNDKTPVLVLDIGFKHTSISIIDKGCVMVNRGVDTGSSEFTRAVSQGMGIDFNRAEQLKREIGLKQAGTDHEVSKLIMPMIDIISNETFRLINVYMQKNNRRIEQVIVTGGGSRIEGLIEYFEKNLNMKVLAGNPWARVVYNTELDSSLREIAPFFSVSIGLAMREL